MPALAVKPKLASGKKTSFDADGVIAVASLVADLPQERSAANDERTSDESVHTDHLGTPRAGTNSMGVVTWRWEGEACGTTAPTGTATVNLRFPGMVADAESGLFYNWHRYFDPKTCRYTQFDPVGLAGGLNGFTYGLNNPLKYIDPDGQNPLIVQGILRLLQIGLGALTIATEDVPILGGSAAAKVCKTAAQPGKTVLGHYPEYIELSNKLGARRFDIPTDVWNKMTPAQQWAANQKFLDRLINRGGEIILATPASQARPGSFFAKELEYLSSKGYQLGPEGTRMIPPP